MSDRILYICETEGRNQVEKTRSEWNKNGYSIDILDFDIPANKLNFNNYFLIAFAVDHSNCDIFFKYSRLIRSVTKTPIVFFVYGGFSENDELRLISDGKAQVFNLNSNIKLNIANCIALIKYYLSTPDYANDIFLLSAEKIFLDVNRYLVHVDKKEIVLTHLEYNILHFLMQHRDQVMSYEQIYSAAWGAEYVDNCRNILWNHIKELRKKLQWHPGLPEYIITKRGIGYSFSPRS